MVAVPLLRIPFTIIWACMEAGGRNKPSTGIKALTFSWSSGQMQWKESQKIPILPKLKLNGNTISLICNSEKFRLVSNSAKRDANGFFKVLWLSLHLLNSRHSVRKSKFGTCAVTGYCSFNLLITLNINIYCDIYIWYIPIRKVNWMLRRFVPFSYLDDKAIFKSTYTITTNNRVLNYLPFSYMKYYFRGCILEETF